MPWLWLSSSSYQNRALALLDRRPGGHQGASSAHWRLGSAVLRGSVRRVGCARSLRVGCRAAAAQEHVGNSGSSCLRPAECAASSSTAGACSVVGFGHCRATNDLGDARLVPYRHPMLAAVTAHVLLGTACGRLFAWIRAVARKGARACVRESE